MSHTDYTTAQTPTVAQNPTAQNPAAQNPDAQNPTAQNPAAQNPAAQSCASQDHQGPQDRGPQGRSAKERGGLGVAHFADGSPMAVSTALRWADQAEVAWCVTTPQGAVLDLYRTRRIASPSQTVALIARDGGCSFPGCDTPPSWCERHHIVAWQDGGATNLDNLTLVCRYHHRHFETGGWTCRMNADGLPVWIPPTWVDRQRRPILHPRIILNHWNPQDPLDL
jgi:hypothetical protein